MFYDSKLVSYAEFPQSEIYSKIRRADGTFVLDGIRQRPSAAVVMFDALLSDFPVNTTI